VTKYLDSTGTQEIIVKVWDPSQAGTQPSGKQDSSAFRTPGGITYTPATGIWQTVWFEIVPPVYISDIRNIPDLDNIQLVTSANISGSLGNNSAVIVVNILIDDVVIAKGSGAPNTQIIVPIPLNLLYVWSPTTPFLYSLTFSLVVGGSVVDVISSYFGMRKIEVLPDPFGIPRAHLNGEVIFQVGTLDQGYWPDGIYTAPTDQALQFDLLAHKNMGFNLVRKHMKVEPERWYYWADVLGLLVWQDMVAGNWIIPYPATPSYQANFQKELLALVTGPRKNHPSIVQWTVFNEGWGQLGPNWTIALTELVKGLDKSRLVADCSGWTDYGVGDNLDIHHYPDPQSPQPDLARNREAILGEFGGILFVIPNSQWAPGKCHGYTTVLNANAYTSLYTQYANTIANLQTNPGLSATVFTQLTDVETECNGILTYDRNYKVSPSLIYQANAALTNFSSLSFKK